MPSILGGPHIPASSPQDAASTAMRGSRKAAESPHLSGMAKDNFSCVQFSEVFWALPEHEAPASRSGSQFGAAFPSQAGKAWPRIVGLNAVVSDTSSESAERAFGSQEHVPERDAQSDEAGGELGVAKSQLQALQDLVLSLQTQLSDAHHKQSALNEQLRHTSACLKHLQQAQQAWELERALQATRMDAGQLTESEVQDSHAAAQTQMVEAALQEALLQEGQLMAEIISLQPVSAMPETESEVLQLSDKPREGRTPDVLQSAADASSAAGDNASPTTKELEVPQQSTKVGTVASSQAAAKPEQLRHARSVIAELSAKLAELECCNALLQDQLAISASDLIKSGPQHTWLADSFPWEAQATAESGDKSPQDSTLAESAVDITQDAESIAPDEEILAVSRLQDESLEWGHSGTDLAGDVATFRDAAGHTAGLQEPFTASEEHAPSAAAPAGPGQVEDTWPDAQPNKTPNLTESAGSEAARMSFSRLSAAEEQNARLAATHAELERHLLHAQNQLREFQGAASAHMSTPDVHAAQEALTQAVAGIRSTGPQKAPQMLLNRASAEPLRISASSQGPRGHLNGTQALSDAADMESELAASKARLARTAEHLAESERCRDHLEQQLLDVGEARHNEHLHGLQYSTGLRADVADSTAKLALLTQQLAESERCRDRLQQQLLDLGEARLMADLSGDQPTRQPANTSQAVSSSAEAPARRDVAMLESSAGEGSQSAAEREPGTTLEAATSEVAALRVAMTQSESIFLDLEAQLRAAFEREAASQLRIAALEQELKQAGIHARPASVVQPAMTPVDSSALVPFVYHQSLATDITMMQPQSQEARAVVVYGSKNSQKAAQQNRPADDSTQQTRLLTAQLRAALQQVSDAETVIERLHDQLFNQHALITELRLAQSASGQSSGIPDASLGAAAVKAEAGSKALQLEYPASSILLNMAIVEEIPTDSVLQPGTAGEMQLTADESKVLQVSVATASAASIVGFQTAAKPTLPGSAHISQLAVTCALIAGQTEFPEELYSLVTSRDTESVSSQGADIGRVLAWSDDARHSQSDAVREHTASAHSASQRMRENPLFLQGKHQG